MSKQATVKMQKEESAISNLSEADALKIAKAIVTLQSEAPQPKESVQQPKKEYPPIVTAEDELRVVLRKDLKKYWKGFKIALATGNKHWQEIQKSNINNAQRKLQKIDKTTEITDFTKPYVKKA